MSIESMIFAKNRHMFGGLEPPEMESLSATVRRVENTSRAILSIKAILPEDSTITNASGEVQTLCTVKGAVIRKCTDHYPVDEFDGEEIANITENTTIEDSYLLSDAETTYYYRAFVYSDQGVYNRGFTYGKSIVRVTEPDVNDAPVYLFGYDLDTADSNPATRVTYPDDVDNAYYQKANWNIAPGKKFMPKPCMLKYDGTVGEYLDPNDYTVTVEGEPSNVANLEYEGNAMMEWPKIYTKRWEDENGVYHFRCSNIKIDEDWDCWCNYDINDNVIDHFYTAIYSGRVVNGKLRSMELGTDTPSKRTLSVMVDFAMANDSTDNKDWYIQTFVDRCLIKDLIIMMGKSTDIAAICANDTICDRLKIVLGDGYLASGFNNGCVHASVLKVTRGTHDGTRYEDYAKRIYVDMSFGARGYIDIPFVEDCSYTYRTGHNGYITKMAVYPWGRFPSVAGGSSTTYECEYFAASYTNTNIFINPVYTEECMTGSPTELRLTVKLDDGAASATLSCKPVKIIE